MKTSWWFEFSDYGFKKTPKANGSFFKIYRICTLAIFSSTFGIFGSYPHSSFSYPLQIVSYIFADYFFKISFSTSAAAVRYNGNEQWFRSLLKLLFTGGHFLHMNDIEILFSLFTHLPGQRVQCILSWNIHPLTVSGPLTDSYSHRHTYGPFQMVPNVKLVGFVAQIHRIFYVYWSCMRLYIHSCTAPKVE